MASTTRLPLAGKLLAGFAGVIVPISWHLLQHGHRPTSVSPMALEGWWWTIAGFHGLLFLLAALGFHVIFRRLLDRPILVISLCNLFMVVMLIALFCISDDPSVRPVLDRVGLGGLRWCFLASGLLWFVVFFCLLSYDLDVLSKRKSVA
jgi:hypothetical protein